MSNIVLDIENVSKQYRLGEVGTGTLSNDLKRWWFSVRGKEDPFLKIGETNDRTQKGESDYVWALRDINFQVEQGQAVGIIGRNGAGKSTLLKLLSRVTKPTTGTIKYKGRIASLLEVGTGFHPEMTGRENIYLNGAILGMTRNEISRKFDEIVDFAGVERYIDTPVKRYSSGMYVRLAFAVAAHLESEILIVDEVLAVGDAEFQKKCLGKMGDVSKGEGRTILFVSHNMAAVKNLCQHGILLENGLKKFEGSAENCVKMYLSRNKKNELTRTFDRNSGKYGSNDVRLTEVRIKTIADSEFITINDTFDIEIDFETYKDFEAFNLSIPVKDFEDDNIIFAQITQFKFLKAGNHKAILRFPSNFLNAGAFSTNIYFVNNSKSFFRVDEFISFEIKDDRTGLNYFGKWPGYFRPNLDFKITS